MSSTLIDNLVTDRQLARYADVIYRTTGISISQQKKALLSNRIRRRLQATGFDCFDAYLNHLVKLPASAGEWSCFFQEVTTHETYMFRDSHHWQWVSEVFLPEVQADAAAGRRPKRLRLWSAACSNGDEAYTLAICLAEGLRQPETWDIEILATDIGRASLQLAEQGCFAEKSMRHVPDRLRRRHFEAEEDQWRARPALRRWLKFRQHNLLHAAPLRGADLVLVKNVLIYFDQESKQRVLGHVLSSLQAGGYLISGPAEGISNLVHGLHKPAPWLYRKPGGAAPVED